MRVCGSAGVQLRCAERDADTAALPHPAGRGLEQRLVIDRGRAYDAPYSWPGGRTRMSADHRERPGMVSTRPSWTGHIGDTCRGRARHATDDRSQVHGADDAGVRGDARLLYAHGGDQGAGRDGEGGHTPHHDPRREGRRVHGRRVRPGRPSGRHLYGPERRRRQPGGRAAGRVPGRVARHRHYRPRDFDAAVPPPLPGNRPRAALRGRDQV